MSYTKNYYHVLGLETPTRGSSNAIPAEQVKQAYKKMLFSVHPDKGAKRNEAVKPLETTRGSNGKNASNETGGRHVGLGWTVDDVKEAYTVLGNEKSKGEYDRWLSSTSSEDGYPSLGSCREESEYIRRTEFVAGLERLDLSDFEEVEVGSAAAAAAAAVRGGVSGSVEEGGRQMEWVRSCRCGAERGYRVLEAQLEGAEREGGREVVVGCEGCSLWVRVAFDVEDDDDDD